MSRAQRLLALLEELRCHRYPVSAAALAARLDVSVRTLYRDIATLQAQGARIVGEPGVGYVLRPGFILPPLAFTDEEVEALVLGARWVADRADTPLGTAARHALAKIRAVLPAERRAALEEAALFVASRRGQTSRGHATAAGAVRPAAVADEDAHLAALRRAIRDERKVTLTYRDPDGRESVRIVWPFAIGFFDATRVVAAWCELRHDYRHFRTDRVTALSALAERYPRRRHVLMREWEETRGIRAQTTDGI